MNMNEIAIFKSPEFGAIRTLTIEGEPWFVGKDVAERLGYSNTKDALTRHVDAEDKHQGDGVVIRDPMGREQHPVIINESGLYSLVLSSKLPTAKAFKRWVTSEVIPAIRKHGGYLAPEKLEEALLNPDTLIRLATDLKAEREHRRALEAEREANQPKVLMPTQKAMERQLFEIKETAITHSDGHVTVSKTPKVTGIGQQYFVNRFLKEGGAS